MKIAFYAPMKAPTHAAPSGDRRMARNLWRAIELAGHTPWLASEFRSFEGRGDGARQAAIEAEGHREADNLIASCSGEGERPDLWFTYHLYHKAPDWLGPAVSAALDIPYVVAEASFARKQTGGPFERGLAASAQAIARADAVLSITPEDEDGIRALVPDASRLLRLRPFLDAAPFDGIDRDGARQNLADTLGLDSARPWLLAVGMMRPGDKLASYRLLGRALSLIDEPPWQLLVVGDGDARSHVEEALAPIGEGRVFYAGAIGEDDLPSYYTASDLFVWPAYNEAYGMAMLEAQAAGLPVIAGNWRGVPEIVTHDETGLLTPPGDDVAFAEAVVGLTTDRSERERMRRAAHENVRAHHDMQSAAGAIQAAFTRALARP